MAAVRPLVDVPVTSTDRSAGTPESSAMVTVKKSCVPLGMLATSMVRIPPGLSGKK